jgi:hypothetical protein
MQFLRRTIIAAALMPSLAMAQQSTVQGADPAFLQAALNTLHDQRNRVMDEALNAEATLALAQQRITDLERQLSALRTERDDLKAKNDTEKTPLPNEGK